MIFDKARDELEAIRDRLLEKEVSLHEKLVTARRDLDSVETALAAINDDPVVPTPERTTVARHTGKYRTLWEYLTNSTNSELHMTFAQIEEILGFPLPPSSRNHPPHWYGYKGSAVARAVQDAGWKARNVDLKAETVEFFRA